MIRTHRILPLATGLLLISIAFQGVTDVDSQEPPESMVHPHVDDMEKARVAGLLALKNCAWQGPYIRENPKANTGLPDYGAFYWTLIGTAPKGASLRFRGQYPRSRYFSYNTYRMDGTTAPYHGLIDKVIVPEKGQPANPFLSGNRRDVQSSYVVDIVWDIDNDNSNNDLRPNQLLVDLFDQATYDRKLTEDPLAIFPTFSAEERGFEIMYRVYLHDDGMEGLGGAGFPRLELTLDGVTYDDQEDICDLLAVRDDIIEAPLMDPETQYLPLRRDGNPYTAKNYYRDDNGDPDNGEITWRASYDQGHDMRCAFFGKCEREGPRAVGFYPNLDNGYLNAWIDNRRGAVILTEGKLPITPRTLAGSDTYDDANAQLRYWSLCSYEFYSQRLTDCVFDESLVLDVDRRYAVVISKREDRPKNATEACGYNWLEFPEWGDNLAMLHDPTRTTDRRNNAYDALLLNRQMAPYGGFSQSVHETRVPGDEKRVMGAYLQQSRYMSIEGFEKMPCRKVVN